MRTLHADLTTAQHQDSSTPYIELNFRSRDGATTRSFKTTDGTNRVQLVQQAEGRYGGTIAVPGSQDISAVIQLRDADNSLVVLDWKGYRLDIAWGYNTDSGDKAVHDSTFQNGEGEPLYVIRQRSVSSEGDLYLELECASLWGILNRLWLNRTSQATIEYKKGTSNEADLIEIVHELLGGSTPGTPATPTLGTVVTQVDSGTYTSYASESRNRDLNDVLLVPEDGSGVGDATYFGLDGKFNRISINLSTGGTGSWGIEWEFWNGSSWTSLSPQPLNNRTFNTPSPNGHLVLIDCGDSHLSSWTAINLNTTGFGGAGPDSAFPNSTLFYIRARVSSQSSFSVRPAASFVTMAMDFASEMNDDTAAEIGFKPNYESVLGERLADTLKGVQTRVRLRTVLKRDGFHTRLIDKNQVGQDYSYSLSGDHTFFSAVLEDGPIIPNEVVVISVDPGVAGGVEGSASDAGSIASIGNITWVVKEESVTTEGEADSVAQAVIDSLIWDTVAGDIEVPMNIGQEIWDKVEVIDSRSGETFTGFVSGLERIYEPGTYKLRIQMGGLDRIVQPRWLVQAQRHIAPAQEVERRRIAIQTAKAAPLLPIPDIDESDVRRRSIQTARSSPLGDRVGTDSGPEIRLDNPTNFRDHINFRGGNAMAFPLELLTSPDETRWANPISYNPDREIELSRIHSRPDNNILTEKIRLFLFSVHQATLSAGAGAGPIYTVEQTDDHHIFKFTGTGGSLRPFGTSFHPPLGQVAEYWGTVFTNQIAFIDKTTDPLANGEIQLNSADVKVFSGGAVRNLSNISGSAGAPNNEAYVTIGNNGPLIAERALTGTGNQVIITDNGPNSTVVLSLPQDIDLGAIPAFVGLILTTGPLAWTDVSAVVAANTEIREIASPAGSLNYNVPSVGTHRFTVNAVDVFVITTNIQAFFDLDMINNSILDFATLRENGTEAAAGVIRLANDSIINWRNAANTDDVGIRINASNQLITDVGLDMNGQLIENIFDLQDNSANPAAAGFIRIGNDIAANWRNAANSADLGIKLNTSDEFEISGFVHHPMILVHKTADETINNVGTLQDDNHLLFTVVANETWFVEITIFYVSATDADIFYNITVPSGATVRFGHNALANTISSVTGDMTAFSSTTSNPGAGGTGGSDVTATYYAFVEIGATPGTIQFVWAQTTAQMSNTTVRKGSYLKAFRL